MPATVKEFSDAAQLAGEPGESSDPVPEAAGLPPGLGINTVSGLISGTTGGTAAGVYPPIVSVSDGTHTVSTTFAWVINAA